MAPEGQTRSGPWWASLLALALAAWKCRSMAPAGRFWAEEGTVFYPAMLERSLFDGLGFVHGGRFDGATNLVLWLAARAGLDRAPLVSTAAAVALGLATLWLVRGVWSSLGLTTAGWLFVVALFFGLPESVETWATALNLGFLGALVAWAVLIAPAGANLWRHRLWLGLAGLSGALASVLLPLFVFRAWRERSREHGVRAGVLGAAAIVHVAVAVAGAGGSGGSPLGLLDAVYASLTHLVLVPLLGAYADPAAARMVAGGPVGALLVVAGAAVLGLAVTLVVKLGSREAKLTLAAAAILAASTLLLPQDGGAGFASTLGGARYFFAPSLLVLTALVLALHSKRAPWLGAVSLAVMAIIAVQLLINGLWKVQQGPEWRAALERARAPDAPQPRTVDIWPTGWKMPLNPSP